MNPEVMAALIEILAQLLQHGAELINEARAGAVDPATTLAKIQVLHDAIAINDANALRDLDAKFPKGG